MRTEHKLIQQKYEKYAIIDFMDNKDFHFNNLIEDKKILWTVVIVLTGGLVGLLISIDEMGFNFHTIIRIAFFIFGSYVWYYMVKNLISVTDSINKFLRR